MTVTGIKSLGVNNYTRTNSKNVNFGAKNEVFEVDEFDFSFKENNRKPIKIGAVAAVLIGTTGAVTLAAKGKGPKFLQKTVRRAIDTLRSTEAAIAKKVSKVSGNIAENATQALQKSKDAQLETLLTLVKKPVFERNKLNKKEFSAKSLRKFMETASSSIISASKISDDAALKVMIEARKPLSKAFSAKGEQNYLDAFHLFFQPLMRTPKKFNILSTKTKLADSFLLQNSFNIFSLKGINKKHQKDFAYSALQLAKNNKEYAAVITEAIKNSTADKEILKWVKQVETGKDLSYRCSDLIKENISKTH